MRRGPEQRTQPAQKKTEKRGTIKNEGTIRQDSWAKRNQGAVAKMVRAGEDEARGEHYSVVMPAPCATDNRRKTNGSDV